MVGPGAGFGLPHLKKSNFAWLLIERRVQKNHQGSVFNL
jgi:hypothetical protein